MIIADNKLQSQAGASRADGQAGFVLAPVLYVIAILGVLGSVFFTGYIQTVRSYSEVTAANTVRNELQLASEIIASRSTQQAGAPPTLDTPAAAAMPVSSDVDHKRLARTPAGAAVTAAFLNPGGNGSASSAGTVPVNIGIKRIDPWGRLYFYCQWNSQQSPGSDASFSVISAGADGKLETSCLSTAAATGSDDRIQYLTVASAMARSRSWQAQADNTYRFGVDASSSAAGRVVVGVDTAHDTDASQQLNIGGNGKFGGNLTVSGNLATTYVNAAMVNATGVANTGDQSVGGKLDIAGAIMNSGTASGGNVIVNDAMYIYNPAGTGPAVKVLGSGTAGQPELAAYAATGNAALRLASQGSGNVIIRTNNTDQMVVSGNGNIGIGTSTPNSKLDINGGLQAIAILNLSDRRLKEDILPITDPLAQVRKLRGVRFVWKKDGAPSVGLIAQEVETVFPELVQTGADGIKAVMYANLVAPLIEAVKTLAAGQDRQQTANEEIRQAMAALQTRLAVLEHDNRVLAAQSERSCRH